MRPAMQWEGEGSVAGSQYSSVYGDSFDERLRMSDLKRYHHRL